MFTLGIKNRLDKVLDWCLDWVWPRYCLGCQKEGEWVCTDCQKIGIEMDKTFCCPECRLKNTDGGLCASCREKWRLDHLLVACRPTDLLRNILLNYKYKDIYRLRDILVYFLVEKIKNRASMYDVITYVPLHKKRENWRGFNQSAWLAEGLAGLLKIKYGRLLKREKNIVPQVNFDRSGRMKNVQGAFSGCMGTNESLEGKNILVIDDVCTTGATINECGKVLKECGASRVDGLVIVRGTVK